MEKMQSYVEVLLKNALNLKKKDSLFISIPSTEKEMVLEIEKRAKQIGLTDIFIFYNNLKNSDNKIIDYIKKNAKFLFFTNEIKDDLNASMVNDIINMDMDMDYTIAVLPSSKLFKKDEFYKYASISGKDDVTVWNKKIIENGKIVSQIKNYQINLLKIEDTLDTDISMHLSPVIIGNSVDSKMKFFPNYKVELVPQMDTANGFVSATAPLNIGSDSVEDLRLSIDKGHVVDYDCSKGYNAVKTVLNINFSPIIEAIGLIDKDEPTYNKYGNFNNIVLDRTSSPYVLISSYDEKNDEKNYLVVPIGTGSLKVTGYNAKGKNICLYEEEGFSKKLMPNRK